jgi:hypothetical protein
MKDLGRTIVFVFAVLFVIAGLRMALVMTKPYISSIPVVGDSAASVATYLVA